MVKTIYWIQHTKKIDTEKNGDKDEKTLYKLMDNVLYHETIKNMRM